jgi:predicted  nucleic acid-binding Zn-ribbon protein
MDELKATSDKFFNLANSPKFAMACMDVMDNKPPLQRDPLQRIGDRMRFLESLENYGYTVVTTYELRKLETDVSIRNERDKNLVKALRELKSTTAELLDVLKDNHHQVSNQHELDAVWDKLDLLLK